MYMYTHRINVELANLCPVPQYLVHGGMHDMHSLMKKVCSDIIYIYGLKSVFRWILLKMKKISLFDYLI